MNLPLRLPPNFSRLPSLRPSTSPPKPSMSIPPPGLGGGVARTGPPPGFGVSGNVPSPIGPSSGGGRGNDGQGGTAVIVRAQIVFLLTTMTEESFEKGSNEIRSLASTNGPEMYHHFLRRATVVANPVLQTLIQHSQQYQDDPAAPPPSIPTSGQAALVWRLLVTESMRAARDLTLAPHFALMMLSPSPSTPLPLPSLRIFNLPPTHLFSLIAYTLASPNVLPAAHPAFDSLHTLLRQTYQTAIETLRSPQIPFWATNAVPNQTSPSDDLSLQEARTLILALYANAPPTKSDPRPAMPINPTPAHPSPLSTAHRETLLTSLTAKFSSPAIILQTLSALSPGGPPRSPGSLPLEDLLFELGENLTQDEGTVEAVVQRWWGPYLLDVDDPDRHQRLLEEQRRTMAGLCEGLQDGRMVDLHGVVKGLCANNWVYPHDLIRSFDVPNSLAAFQSSIPLLISLILIPDQHPIPPISGLLPASLDSQIWAHIPSLLNILTRLTTLPPDALPLFTMPNGPPPDVFARIIDPPSTDISMGKAARQQSRDIQGAGLWNTLGLIQVLVAACGVAETEHTSPESADIGRKATDLLEKAAALAPELVLVALEKLYKPLPASVARMHNKLLALYLSSPPATITSSQLVFQSMMQHSPEGLLAVLAEFYEEDENNLGRVVDIGLELKILDRLLAADSLHLALDVASLVSNKGYLDLEQWLADAVSVKGDDFLQGIFDFVEHKIMLEIDHQHQPDSVPSLRYTLGIEVYSIFIRVIRNAEDLSQDDIARFKRLRTDILIIYPRLLNLLPNSRQEQGVEAAQYSKDVVEQVDEMYEGLYMGNITLDDLVNELKERQKSVDEREQTIFACALHSLFDEYKFVKTYPDRQLIMTGILFGAIIDYRLVKDVPAFVVTRYVLDACKTSPHESLYQFGINALSVLRASLVDFPGLCRSLLEIPALHESHPVLINDIVAALAERDDLDLQGGVKLAFPALKLPILVEEGDDEFNEPDSKKKDAFMFIINQIAPSNYEAKSLDLLNLFENQYSRWFAHYFIDIRVSLELNRHEIYLKLIELAKSPILERHVLWETYRKARDLLNSEASINSASERTTLKAIAMWLGRITLARNRPIRLRELSLKDLLIQGYDNKRLIVAIPFVCNLLAFCKDSAVFHPPNPWMVSVLGLLAEFYLYADLRLNLKFEIEVLFSKLDVEIKTIKPTNDLRSHVPPPEPQPDLPNRLDVEWQRARSEVVNGTQRFDPPINDAFARMQAYQSEQAAQAAQDAFARRVDELILQLPEFLVFSPDHPIFTAPSLKRVAHHSIDRAIREIINPVVERSVTIAGISSRDLVQKDFGMDGDAMKMRHAAHLMVQNLAGNLALVTCKEPLRTAMVMNIRSMLAQNGFTDENMPESSIGGVVNDNLDVACSVVKKAAMEKAAKDIDVNLAPQYSARRAHQDPRNHGSFSDGASFGVVISHTALPDPLRLRQGGLSDAQLRVYEDFGEPARVMSSVNGDYGYQELVPAEIKRGLSPLYPGEEAAPAPQVLPPQTSLDKFQELIGEMENFLARAPMASLSALPAENEVENIVNAVVMVANQSSNRENTTLGISQKVVQLLYKSSSPLGREAYVFMLGRLCDLSIKVDKEVKSWLLYAEDSRKFNVPVTVTLIRASFLTIPELDSQLTQLTTRSIAPEVLDFSANLVRDCVLSEQPIVARGAFSASLAALIKAREMGNSTSAVDMLLDDLRGVRSQEMSAQSSNESQSKQPIDLKLQERLATYFLEWVRIFSTNKNPEGAFVPYITYLQKEGILNGEDISSAFYRTAINCAVDLDSGKMDSNSSYYGADSLAKLIVLIVKNYGDKSGSSSVNRTVYYYNKIFTIISYSLVQRQLDDGFNQRPWGRFLTSMLSELTSIENSLPDTYIGCLKSFANSLGIIQPTYAPRFAFGWLSIVSHRLFMPRLLAARDEGWPEFHRCLMWLLRFLAPFLDSEMATSSRGIFQGTLRLLLVLMHDFPEFLVEFYHSLSTAIPTHCVQLRNIVLAAFPHSEGPLPDCYTRLDQLVPKMQRFPTVRSDYMSALQAGNIRAAVDQHVRTGVPPAQAIVGELKNRIAVKSMTPDGSTIITWNHTLLHAAVFYIGTTCVQRKFQQTGLADFDAKAPEVALLTNLAFAFDAEGQYYMLSVIGDQLRYPSAHSLFYISFTLFLFGTAARAEVPNAIPERIGRVLLERVIVRRPHPWGLMVTFIELLNNEVYGFWKQPFVRAEEEIFLLFGKAHQNFVSEA